MSDAEKIVEVLVAHQKEMGHRDLRVHCICGWSSRELPTYVQYIAHLAAALEPVIREREKAAWDSCAETAGDLKSVNSIPFVKELLRINPYDGGEEV